MDEGGKPAMYSDVFIVTVPDDLTKPGPLGPVEGTSTDYPKPPAGAVVRRLTRTAEAADLALRGVSGHLRTSGDGRWIAFVGKVRDGSSLINQVFLVSPETKQVRQLSHVAGGIVGDPRFSPDGRYIAAALPDGYVFAFNTEPKTYGEMISCTPRGHHPASNIVISPDSRSIAYNREVNGFSQVFISEMRLR
jgi:hypothetical protein